MLTKNIGDIMWYSIKAAAKAAGVSHPTVKKWMADGLRHTRLGYRTVRIKQEWLDEYLERFEDTEDDDIKKIMGG